MRLSTTPTRFTRSGRLLAVVALIAMLFFVPLGPAAAVSSDAVSSDAVSSDAAATHAWVAHEVGALLAHNPGSVQISERSVRAAGGAVITAVPASASGRCPGGNVCVFWDSVWRGDQLTMGPYNGCAYYNLNNYYGSNGQSWANKASSIDNPLPRPNPPARFAHNGTYVFSVAGGHYYKNLAEDYGSNGHVMNDYITNVRTC
jgi:hypothetical protein